MWEGRLGWNKKERGVPPLSSPLSLFFPLSTSCTFRRALDVDDLLLQGAQVGVKLGGLCVRDERRERKVGERKGEEVWSRGGGGGGPFRSALCSFSLCSLPVTLSHLLQHEFIAFVGGGYEGGGEHARGLADLEGGKRGERVRERRPMGRAQRREDAGVFTLVLTLPFLLLLPLITCSVMRRMRTPMVARANGVRRSQSEK